MDKAKKLQLISELEEKNEILEKITSKILSKISKIQKTLISARQEINNNSDITPQTCEKGARLFSTSEKNSIKLFSGFTSMHETASGLIPEGANEGNKEWPL